MRVELGCHGERKAPACAYNGSMEAEPPVGVQGAKPPVGVQGQSPLKLNAFCILCVERKPQIFYIADNFAVDEMKITKTAELHSGSEARAAQGARALSPLPEANSIRGIA